MDKNNELFFSKVKDAEASSREFGSFMREFSKKRVEEIKNVVTGNKEEKECNSKNNDPLYSTPHEVIYSESSWRILRYNNSPENKEPWLIIPSLINKYYILDLMENVSFVKFLRDKGVNVYLIDWGTPSAAHDHLSLGTYTFKWIGRAVKKVLRDSESEKLTLMGYCMGATISAIYASQNQDKVNGFISLAAPYDFSGDDALTAMAKELDVDKFISAFGTMSPEMLEIGFAIAQPTSLYHKMKSLYANGNNEKRNSTFTHLERWLSDNVPFPGEAYKEYIKKLYQENELYNEKLTLDGVKISLSDITIPVLNVIAKKDNIVAEKAALALNEKVKSKDKDLLEIDAGHIGVIMGRKALAAWEEMHEWFLKVNELK